MRVNEFEKLRIIDMKGEYEPLENQEYFLTPELEGQRAGRKAGDIVTVYKVIEIKSNGNVVYTPEYLTLVDSL